MRSGNEQRARGGVQYERRDRRRERSPGFQLGDRGDGKQRRCAPGLWGGDGGSRRPHLRELGERNVGLRRWPGCVWWAPDDRGWRQGNRRMRGRPERRGDGVVEWVSRGVEREQRGGGDERVAGVQLGDVEIRQRRGREPWIRRLDRWARRRGLGGRRERDERGGRSGLRVGGSQHGDDGWGVRDGERRRKREEQREREGGDRERGNRRVERAAGLQLGSIAGDGQLGCGAAGLWSGDRRSRRER